MRFINPIHRIITRTVAFVFSLFAVTALPLPMSAIWAQTTTASNAATDPNGNSVNRKGVPAQSNPGVVPDNYRIGPSDLLAINVWKDTEISRTMPVRPDGRISLPLIGEVQAAGMSVAQLQAVIVQKLSAYMSHPEVNVSVQEIKSRSFNIIGRVNKAGSYDLLRPMTVLDAIAEAGGFQDFAKQKDIYILREKPSGGKSRFPFNYKNVIKGKHIEQNIALEPNDTIIVP